MGKETSLRKSIGENIIITDGDLNEVMKDLYNGPKETNMNEDIDLTLPQRAGVVAKNSSTQKAMKNGNKFPRIFENKTIQENINREFTMICDNPVIM